jgi:hypothetical protein
VETLQLLVDCEVMVFAALPWHYYRPGLGVTTITVVRFVSGVRVTRWMQRTLSFELAGAAIEEEDADEKAGSGEKASPVTHA